MGPGEYLLAGVLSMATGLDRVALLQFMISRPLVAGPLAGWAMGMPLIGLHVGILLELLWLGRLPVGAAIPPDDTQVAIGATVMAVTLERLLGIHGMPVVILCVLMAIPLGKFGQWFDRLARNANDRLSQRAAVLADDGDLGGLERLHLGGLLHFALASLGTCLLIVVPGTTILYYVSPWLIDAVRDAGLSLQYSFTLIGAAVLLGTININRGISLFCAAFVGTLLVFWLR